MIHRIGIRCMSGYLCECCETAEAEKPNDKNSVPCGVHRPQWPVSHPEYFVVRCALLGPKMDKYNSNITHLYHI